MSIGYPAIDSTEPTAFAACQSMRCMQRGQAYYNVHVCSDTYMYIHRLFAGSIMKYIVNPSTSCKTDIIISNNTFHTYTMQELVKATLKNHSDNGLEIKLSP